MDYGKNALKLTVLYVILKKGKPEKRLPYNKLKANVLHQPSLFAVVAANFFP